MWELVKALAYIVVLVPAVILSCIGLIFQWVQGLIEKSNEQKQAALDARAKAIEDKERERNLLGPHADTIVLEQFIADHHTIFPSADSILETLQQRYFDACKEQKPVFEIVVPLLVAFLKLYQDEGFNEPLHQAIMSGEIEKGRYRDQLIERVKKLQNAGAVFDTYARKALECELLVTDYLPPFARIPADQRYPDEEPPRSTTLTLVDTMSRLEEMIDRLTAVISDEETRTLGLFTKFRKQLEENQTVKHDKNPRAIIDARLAHTRLHTIFDTQVPFEIPISRRLEHTAIVAGSGWGKTQLLQSIIATDLKKENPPAIVVIDSTGAMIKRIQRLAVFNEKLKDRLVIIDPEQTPVPALNMFDVSNPRLQQYDEALRESIESEIVGLFNYVFSSTENPLTAQQATPFAFMVRLLLSMPGANINTLIELLEDNPKNGYDGALPIFKAAIDRLDPTAQTFFKTQYYSRGTSEARRDQIAQRVYGVIKVPAFQRMFSTVNRVDMFAELNKGSVVVVNTSENLLKDASATFGRYMIARTMAAAFERASIPEGDRRPAFLIVDEAAPYFDDTFEKLLTRVRQFKLGVVIAFQHLEQASQKLRSAIASSTSVKYAGGVGFTDRAWLAREMETSHDFIGAQKKDSREPPHWSQFACYVRNFTDNAVSLTVPFYQLENEPKMSDEEHRRILQLNREQVSYTAPPQPAPLSVVSDVPQVQMASPQERAATISKENW